MKPWILMGDGIGNNADTDDDGDGVNDENDAFPLDALETFKFAYTFDASQLGTQGHVLTGFVAGNLLARRRYDCYSGFPVCFSRS